MFTYFLLYQSVCSCSFIVVLDIEINRTQQNTALNKHFFSHYLLFVFQFFEIIMKVGN